MPIAAGVRAPMDDEVAGLMPHGRRAFWHGAIVLLHHTRRK